MRTRVDAKGRACSIRRKAQRCTRGALGSDNGPCDMMNEAYPRDLIGYGRNPPDPRWPGGARMAVQFVVDGVKALWG